MKDNKLKNLRYENSNIDRIDCRIIEILAENARMSVAEIARTVNLSAPSVADRIKRLEETGIISGYTIKVNYEALGFPVAAWLRIRQVPGELQRVMEIIKSLPEVVHCDRITGEDCFIARVHVKTQKELEALIDKLISYSITNTSIIQSSPVEPRLLSLREKEDY